MHMTFLALAEIAEIFESFLLADDPWKKCVFRKNGEKKFLMD